MGEKLVPRMHESIECTVDSFSDCLCETLIFPLSVCEYYAHLDCQDFVVSDCKECATYGPQKDLVSY